MSSLRWQRPVFLAVTAILVASVFWLAREVMLPIVLGTIIAYVLMPLVEWVEKLGRSPVHPKRRPVPRAAAIILVYVVVLGTLGIFLRTVAPRIGHEMAKFGREVPSLTARFKNEWVPALQSKLHDFTGVPSPGSSDEGEVDEPAAVVRPQPDGSYALDLQGGFSVRSARGGYLIQPNNRPTPFDADRFIAESVQGSIAYVQHNALELARIGSGIVFGIGRFFFVFGLTLMIAAYLMLTRERVLGFFASLLRPSSRPAFDRLMARIDRGLSGVVRGQIIICLINGVLSAIGLAIVGLKYWPILAIIATVFSLIPIFGSIISSVPAVALGLTQSFGTGVFVLLWIIGIHQLEANFLNPKIMGDAAKIHPVLVIFSLLVGEHFFHVTGALLAVPCMSIAQSVFIHFRQIVQQTDPELSSEPVASVPDVAARFLQDGDKR
ncbi:AI-2E family transporter [Pendulispora albinea]|uniref:AI-2E family transporter n=1 Tax=Pendulispora albinea TaxID=2741071 RepID=A0ABZ2M992_9BACT